MDNFRHVGPLYCETPPVPDGVFDVASLFPLEPVNVLTSVFPALVGAYLLWYLYRRRLLLSDLLVLAVATLMVGVGSVMWHGVRTEMALFLDWFPGFVAFIIFMFLWPMYLKNRWWGYATVCSLFTLTFVLGPLFRDILPSNGPPIALFFVVGVVASGLLYVTWREYGAVAYWGIAMLMAAIVAAVSRTIDLETCGDLPGFGTHAFWHIALGTASLCGVILLTQIKERLHQSVVESN